MVWNSTERSDPMLPSDAPGLRRRDGALSPRSVDNELPEIKSYVYLSMREREPDTVRECDDTEFPPAPAKRFASQLDTLSVASGKVMTTKTKDAGEALLTHHMVILGMSCASCANRVEEALKNVRDIHACTVIFATNTANIVTKASVDAKSVLDEATSVVAKLGYRVTAVELTSNRSTAGASPTHTLVIEGMSCVSCANRVETALKQMRAVEECTVIFASNTALLRMHGGIAGFNGRSVAELLNEAKQVVEDLGYRVTAIEVGGCTNNSNFPAQLVVIEGMSCTSCASRVEATLSKMEGVVHCSVDFTSSTARVTTAAGLDTEAVLERVRSTIQELGYRVTSITAAQMDVTALEAKKAALERTEELRSLRFSVICSAILAIPELAIMFYMMSGHHTSHKVMLILDLVQMVCVTPIVLYFGRVFFIGAWRSLTHFTFTMDTLVAIGTGLTYLYSVAAVIATLGWDADLSTYFDTAGLLTTFMLLGRLLEANAKRQTGGALLELMNLVPPTATLVLPSGEDVCVPYATITEGALLRVLAGDRIPVDGVIAEGVTEIDEQMVTGESVPRAASVGDKVVGGTLNVGGAIVMEAEKVGEDTMLANILRIVQDAQSSKPAVQRIADRMAMYFVPMVLLLSLATLVTWLVLGEVKAYPSWWRGSQPAELFAFEFFIATIVAACPCALGLATPTAIMVGAGMGARNGVLIKSAATLEAVHKATCVIFDKTGTLTMGKLQVVGRLWLSAAASKHSKAMESPIASEDEISETRQIMRVVEERSNHPAATAVAAAMEQEERESGRKPSEMLTETLEVVTHHGEGLEARVRVRPRGDAREDPGETHHVLVGNTRLLERYGVALPALATEFVEAERSLGRTMVFGAVNCALRVVLSLSDMPKREARGVVSALHSLGLKTMVVTGDHQSAAEFVATCVGIPLDGVRANVLPVNKAEIVKQTQAMGHRVIFVGDGINDGPALVQADVGVALGAGTEVAIEAADAVLIRDSLVDLLNLRDLSCMTVRRVYGNFVWAVGYNILMLPLACGALFPAIHRTLPPLIAGIAMMCSSLCVLMSSLSIRCFRPRKMEELIRRGNEPVA